MRGLGARRAYVCDRRVIGRAIRFTKKKMHVSLALSTCRARKKPHGAAQKMFQRCNNVTAEKREKCLWHSDKTLFREQVRAPASYSPHIRLSAVIGR